MASNPDSIQAPKGLKDILPGESARWQAIERIAREVASLYHFDEIRTPIFEHTELFHRGVGETTDIVSKETYDFVDRDKRSLTLRPEGTAGVARAVIEAGLLNDQGARIKLFYLGPNFRHEQPQKGRYRQHHQFGVEAFGAAEPDQDAECILLQMDFYRRCGVRDLSLRVNSLGDSESKQRYRDALAQFLTPVASRLSAQSQQRLRTNPLRILDSKDPDDLQAIEGAPPASDYLSAPARAHVERVTELLKMLNVPFSIDAKLVRGFDYYTGVVWEVTAGGLGAQNAIGGGGRYDNLVETLGGRPTPGVGFGSGIERLLIALESQEVNLPLDQPPLIWLVSQSQPAREHNWMLLSELRAAGLRADMDLSGRSVKSQFKLADREKATWAVIMGEKEIAEGSVALKNLSTGEQTQVQREQLVARLTKEPAAR